MHPEANHPHEFVLALVAIPVTYLLLVMLGKVLKRHQKVPLGMAYQLFCITLAFWLPLQVYARLESLHDPSFEAVLKQLDALTILLSGFVAIALVRRFFWQVWFEHKYRVQAPKFLTDLGALILFAVALLYVVSLENGEPITGIAVGSTLVAAILGLALQDLLGNIIAGIALEIGKPFRAGDWLVIDGRHQEVIEVNWRSTRLRNNDDIYTDVPNKNIAGQSITNLTHLTKRHALRIQVGFDYDTAPNFVKDRMKIAVAHARGVLPSPPPKVFLKSFGDSSINYEIKFWIDDESMLNDILDSVNTNVWYEAQRSKIKIPYPIRTVQVERPKPPREEDSLEAARAALRNQPLFQNLDDAQTDRLLKGARQLRFGRGERVIHQGSEGSSMFLLLEGAADVFVRLEGHDTRVGSVESGQYCGEMSLLTGEPRSATVVARTDCEMWEIDKSVMAHLLEQNMELVETLSASLADRRMENEGILASNANRTQMESKKKEYAEGFFQRLTSFFHL